MKLCFLWPWLQRILSSAHHLLYYSHWVVDFEELSHERCWSPQSLSQASLWLLRCVWCWSCQRNHNSNLFAFDLRFATQRWFERICIGQMAKSHLRKWDIVVRPQRPKEATTYNGKAPTERKEMTNIKQTRTNTRAAAAVTWGRSWMVIYYLHRSFFWMSSFALFSWSSPSLNIAWTMWTLWRLSCQRLRLSFPWYPSIPCSCAWRDSASSSGRCGWWAWPATGQNWRPHVQNQNILKPSTYLQTYVY